MFVIESKSKDVLNDDPDSSMELVTEALDPLRDLTTFFTITLRFSAFFFIVQVSGVGLK